MQLKKKTNSFTAEDFVRAFEAQDILATAKSLKQKTFNTALSLLAPGLVLAVLNVPMLLSSFAATTEPAPQTLYVLLILALFFIPGLSLLGLHYSSWMHKKTMQTRQRVWEQLPEEYKTSWSRYQVLSEGDATRMTAEYNNSIKVR